ncbi:putative disease resistance protein RGA1 [Coffea eugenioides]|uniref:putative disease resistance protein RGA1 n=1 Tax=Coffea eugenioides TaxID=49369 RepID=UPI000F6112CA|nr:putative disease resistance protein RGA1 [Coffea eugenioides]
MDHFRALCVYERYKRTCNEYEEEQRSLRRASKPRSSSSKRASSKECCDNRVMNSRIESKPHESKADFRSRTKELFDSMMGEISQVLKSYFEQFTHVSTNGGKDVPSSPPLIEEISTNASNEIEIENLEVPSTQVKQGEIELIMACSIPISIGKYQNFHGVCILSVVSLYYPLIYNFTHEPALLVGRSNEVSKGVLALEFCPLPPYHFATSVPSDDPSNEVDHVQSVVQFLSCIMEDPRRCELAANEELRLLCGIETEIQKLSSLLSTTKAVIEDAEQNQFTDKAIQLWLQKLNLIAYEVDDILDDYATEVSREPKCNNICCNVLDCLPATSNIWFRHRIGTRMKDILDKFNAIANEGKDLGLSDQKRGSYFNASRETGSTVNEPEVLGRDEEKEQIVRILTKEKDRVNQNVSVLPIVGVGGLGKTTLAQLVFNDERIAKHFEPKLWVWVSEDFDVKRIIKALIESVEKTSTGDLALNTLQRKLQELLRGRRYLIVLDDVWNENPEEWEKLKSVLECGSKGSSIVMTTRMEKVATIMGTLQTYYLSSLSENECWSLFRQRAFGRQEAEEYPNLVVIGKEIVKKCGGVPLAAKALGGFLRFKREENEWNSVKCSEIWNFPQDTTHILPALRLSYLNLPVELRVEDVGVAVLTELYYRSLFQAVKEDEFGNALTFKMHDLVHDLARSVMKAKHGGTESNRTMILVNGVYPRRVSHAISKLKHLRHLDLSRSLIVELPNSICDLWNLQILNLNDCLILWSLPKGMRFLRNLRHLCLHGCWSLTHMPSGIGKLTCLRTLSMVVPSGKKGFRLSELRDLNMLRGGLTIMHLERIEDKKDAEEACLIKKQSLHGLNLYWDSERTIQRYNDKEVLEALKPRPNLQLLRVLGFNGSSFPSWISTVTEVVVHESAAEYIVGVQESIAAAAAMSPSLKQLELENMPNLKGMLGREVQGTPGVFSQLQSLSFKDCPMLTLPLPRMLSLKELCVDRCPNMAWASISNLTALKELTIKHSPELNSLPEEGLRGLASLQEIHLVRCYNLVSLSMGTKALKSLTRLCINGSHATALPEEVKHLPALQKLELQSFSNLTSLPDWFGDHLTSLQDLTLKYCPLETLPSSIQKMTTLQHLTIFRCYRLGRQCKRGGEEWHKIKHIPDLKIEN